MTEGTVVVTGGAGFLGSHLCEQLVARGRTVLALDDLSTGAADNVAHLDPDRFRLVECDVTHDLRGATDAVGRIVAVLHFASPASPIDYLRMPIETLRVGSLGTLAALELAAEREATFLLASTSEVYGDPLVHPQPEGYWGNVNPVGPRGVYDEAKRFAEAATAAYRRSRGLDGKIVRLFNTFGPRMRPEDGRAIPTFIRQALAGEPLTIAGDGTQTRSICFVDDTVRGVLATLDSGLAGPVNLGNPYEVSMLELARRIREIAGSDSELTFIERPTDDPTVRRPDITLATQQLGWRPQVAPMDGLAATIDWFRGL